MERINTEQLRKEIELVRLDGKSDLNNIRGVFETAVERNLNTLADFIFMHTHDHKKFVTCGELPIDLA
jgi:hypothetical protein